MEREEGLAEVIARRIETEVLPAILRRTALDPAHPSTCGCHVYAAVDVAARIAREVGTEWNR